jgi:hypothetical protein
VTIETIIAASQARVVLGIERPKAGTINVILWTSAKALQSRKLDDVKRAYKQIMTAVADGSLELLASEEQMEMLQWAKDNLDKFATGQLTAIKERVELDGQAQLLADFNKQAAKRSQFEF